MSDETKKRYEFAREHTMPCAQMALKWFRTDEAAPESKSDGTPVTIADRAIETELRRRIQDAFPNDTVRGEEFDDVVGDSGYEWIIDPIDGTFSFVQGVPLFGTMIAVLHEGTPTVGAIAMPCLDETVIAATGIGGVYIRDGHPDSPLRIEPADNLADAVVAITTPECFREPGLWGAYEGFTDTALRVRGWSDCYAFVLLVTGRVHAVVEHGINIWDIASVPPLVEAAGGVWSDFEGDHSVESGNILACGTGLLGACQKVVNEARASV